MTLALLLIAFVVTNIIWIVYLDKRDKREQNERYQLIERNLFPTEKQLPPDRLVGGTKDLPKTAEEILSETVQDEFDLVGEVNPRTPLRND